VFTRFPLQVGGTQTVSAAYLVQPPTPSQAPVCPHVDLSVVAQTLCGSSAPRAVGPQVPRCPLWLQLTHAPLQAVLQQTPSAQNWDAHWAEAEQTAPSGLSPQLPATHFTLFAQSPSEAQVAKHAPVPVSQL
jgi:hypothetical protein